MLHQLFPDLVQSCFYLYQFFGISPIKKISGIFFRYWLITYSRNIGSFYTELVCKYFLSGFSNYIYIFFRFFFVFCFEYVDAVCDTMVGGMEFLRRKMSLQCLQYYNLTFAFVGFVVEIYSKLRSPEIVSEYPKVIYVAHCIYLSWLGRRDGAKRTLSPYIICPMSGQVVYSYQYGHHPMNLSLLRTSEGWLSRNTQK